MAYKHIFYIFLLLSNFMNKHVSGKAIHSKYFIHSNTNLMWY